MDELGTIQDLLMMHDFYMIDAKTEEVGRALGLEEIGLDRDVTTIEWWSENKSTFRKITFGKTGYSAFG